MAHALKPLRTGALPPLIVGEGLFFLKKRTGFDKLSPNCSYLRLDASALSGGPMALGSTRGGFVQQRLPQFGHVGAIFGHDPSRHAP